MNYNILSPADLDHMPVEVATEMLASPKAKLTARLRKNCFAARQRVFLSATPLRRGFQIHDATELTRDGESLLQDADHEQALADKPLVDIARIRALPLDRLARLKVRADRRRRAAQQKYIQLLGLIDATPEGSRRKPLEKLKAALTLRAVQLDELSDAVAAEIKIRAEHAAEPREHRPHAWQRKQAK